MVGKDLSEYNGLQPNQQMADYPGTYKYPVRTYKKYIYPHSTLVESVYVYLSEEVKAACNSLFAYWNYCDNIAYLR